VTIWNTLDGHAPRIIAHRGASGYRPEHTLDGYALAVVQGADVIEPDLVMSRDGVLYARHDLGRARSTDVAQRAEVAGRARELAGQSDWWVGDFSAADIDALRSIQPWPTRPREFDGHFIVPRFGQVLQLAREASLQRGSAVPVYPELKHPEYFQALGLDPVAALHLDLQHHDMLGPQAPVWLQCFDHAVLRAAHERCGNPSFALLESIPPAGPERTARLRQCVGWTCGVAPGKYLLWDGAGRSSGLVEEAHDLGLAVHSWTFREDASPAPFATPQEEIQAAFALGVDALFCDFPDVAVRYRTAYRISATA